MTEKVKQQIDEMDYENMLYKWRFSPIGDLMFEGESGKYFSKVMKEKGEKLTNEERVRTSKGIRWEK